MTIRVLIIDDSAIMQAILMSRLADEPDIAVIGTAASAAEGRELIKRFNPDVITLDIEMTGLNGLDFLEKIMRLRPTPVIAVSGAPQTDNARTARALALGAVDCYAKCNRAGAIPHHDHGKLARLIRQAAKVQLSDDPWPVARQLAVKASQGSRSAKTDIIAVGSSTGGVEALRVMLHKCPVDCIPVLIVQHVNARFAPAIAQFLDAVCPAKVVLAEPGMPVKAGHIYLAPGGDRHMTIGGSGDFRIKLREGDPVSGHVPSVDVLFQSVAETVGARAVGILLTGMGSDGAKGLLAMAHAGAHTIAQDEATSTVFGMPRAAIALGAAEMVAPIDRIARHTFRRGA